MRRSLLAAGAAALCLSTGLLTACSGGDGDTSDSGSGDAGGSDTQTVSADGVSFDVPAGYRTVGADDLTGEGADSEYGDMADSLGISVDQFRQALGSIDLFLASDEGSGDGFVDNINVIDQPVEVPEDTAVKAQFKQIGADVQEIRHPSSDLGEISDVEYTLEAGDTTVQGRGILVAVGDGLVNITVSASDRDVADDLGDRIVESLAEDS